MPPRHWSRVWKAGGFIRRLSGLTLPVSTAARGADAFISSLAEIPASPTALPESAEAQTTNASLSTRSFASSMKSGLFVSSVKTCRGTQTGSSPPSSRHWKEWATGLLLEFSARPKPATATGGGDCSSWPTPMAGTPAQNGNNAAGSNDFSRGVMARVENWKTPAVNDPGVKSERLLTAEGARWTGGERAYDHETGRMAQTGLTQQVENWSTPRASDAEKGAPNQSFGAGGVPLPSQAAHWLTPNVPNGGRTTNHAEISGRTAMHDGKKVQIGLESQVAAWSTPTARMYKGGSLNSLTRKDGKSRLDMLDMLDWQAEAWAGCVNNKSSFPDLPTPDGAKSCANDPNIHPPSTKKRLNIFFVEALMRWPIGWTDCGSPETGLTQWLPLMRGFVSTLCSQRMAPQRQGSLFE